VKNLALIVKRRRIVVAKLVLEARIPISLKLEITRNSNFLLTANNKSDISREKPSSNKILHLLMLFVSGKGWPKYMLKGLKVKTL
jgi:hypothetical protein